MTASKASPSPQRAPSQAVPRASTVMAILLLIFFLGTSDNQMISPLLPLMARDFNLDVGEVGRWMGPAYAIAAATAALLIGPLSDRFGRRKFLLYASSLFAVSLVAVAFINDAHWLAAIRLFTGLAAGTFSTCSIAYVGDYFPYERRGVAMSVVQAGYFAALVIGVPVANIVAQQQSWRWSFTTFGIISMLAFVLVAALLPDDSQTIAEHQRANESAKRFDNLSLAFANSERVAAIFAALFVSAGFVGFLFYLGSWLRKDLSLSTRDVNLFFIVVGFASLIGGLAAGTVADRVGKRLISIISTLLLAAMLFVIPRLGWGALLFASFLCASLAFAFRQGPLQALATELVPAHARGTFVAVRNTASQLGIALSTWMSGWLFDQSGYGAVGLLGSVVTLAAAVCIFIMREPQKREVGVDG